MTKRWIVLAAAFAASSLSFADGDAFSRMHISPITWSRTVDAFLGGKTSTFFIQPHYAWGTGFTEPGVTLAYGTRPNGDDSKGGTLFGLNLNRFDPDSGDNSDWWIGYICHMFTGNDAPYMAGATAYYWTENDWGNGIGANYTVGTMLFANDKDPGFMVTGAFNYAQEDLDFAPIRRGAGLSVGVARALSDNVMLEYDHTFASKFGGSADWFFRTTWDAKPGTQVRLTVGKGEVYQLEVGFFTGSK